MVTCGHCQKGFEITPTDYAFYQKLDIPAPTLCPDCRLERRLAFRNENHLYQASCGLCHQPMISVFKPDAPFPVYCVDCWWSDRWDPLSYGREIDWDRPFFEQFAELFAVVPKANLLQFQTENSPYNAYLAFGKNTYMSPGSYLTENCYYLRKSQDCKDCVNSIILNKCELVASSTNCDTCYSSHHLFNCRASSFSSYLQDCSGVQHGFMCCGIKNVNYCFKNKAYSEAEYQEIINRYSHKTEQELDLEFREFCTTIPKPAQIQVNSDDSTGDYLFHCHNAKNCFDCFDVDTGKYLLECAGVTDSMDLTMHDKGIELCYELCSGGEKNYLTKFGFCAVASPQSEYIISCFYLEHGFGCAQIHNRTQYCILNKQYTKDEYFELKTRLIQHMRQTKEYGEYFPMSLSPFNYSETIAADYLSSTNHSVQPKSVTVSGARQCERCNKPYKIIDQERTLYHTIGVAEPTRCMDCRFQELRNRKNPRTLYHRDCMRCHRSVETTYAPDRPETVFCEDCYHQVTY